MKAKVALLLAEPEVHFSFEMMRGVTELYARASTQVMLARQRVAAAQTARKAAIRAAKEASAAAEFALSPEGLSWNSTFSNNATPPAPLAASPFELSCGDFASGVDASKCKAVRLNAGEGEGSLQAVPHGEPVTGALDSQTASRQTTAGLAPAVRPSAFHFAAAGAALRESLHAGVSVHPSRVRGGQGCVVSSPFLSALGLSGDSQHSALSTTNLPLKATGLHPLAMESQLLAFLAQHLKTPEKEAHPLPQPANRAGADASASRMNRIPKALHEFSSFSRGLSGACRRVTPQPSPREDGKYGMPSLQGLRTQGTFSRSSSDDAISALSGGVFKEEGGPGAANSGGCGEDPERPCQFEGANDLRLCEETRDPEVVAASLGRTAVWQSASDAQAAEPRRPDEETANGGSALPPSGGVQTEAPFVLQRRAGIALCGWRESLGGEPDGVSAQRLSRLPQTAAAIGGALGGGAVCAGPFMALSSEEAEFKSPVHRVIDCLLSMMAFRQPGETQLEVSAELREGLLEFHDAHGSLLTVRALIIEARTCIHPELWGLDSVKKMALRMEVMLGGYDPMTNSQEELLHPVSAWVELQREYLSPETNSHWSVVRLGGGMDCISFDITSGLLQLVYHIVKTTHEIVRGSEGSLARHTRLRIYNDLQTDVVVIHKQRTPREPRKR